jgi:hypothetical protein
MNEGAKLSLKDVAFLGAIRDINESPERYASAETGATPATMTAITEATTLTEEEVAYRLDHPRLGKSGLVKVSRAGPSGDDLSGVHSAKLTESGEATLANAEERQESLDGQHWQPDPNQSEFDDVQEWEPADVESDGPGTTERVAAGNGDPGGVVTESPSISEPAGPATAEREPVQTGAADEGTIRVDEERLTALEARLDELEGEESESTREPGPETATSPERIDSLEEELIQLRETTESLDESLATARSTVEALRESEYGALDENRQAQFQSTVKSMVAFHQLATEVLDVCVENYEPAAGHPEPEAVETTRRRIGDALGVGQRGGESGQTHLGGDTEWPCPDGDGGRVSANGDSEQGQNTDPEPESSVPESGIYPPIGDDDTEDEPIDDETQHEASCSEPELTDDAADPSVLGVDEQNTGTIHETASEKGHVMEPIRATDGNDVPLSVDSGDLTRVREAVVAAADGPSESTSDVATGDAAALPAVPVAAVEPPTGPPEGAE